MLRALVSMLLLGLGVAMSILWVGVPTSPARVPVPVIEMAATKGIPLFPMSNAPLERHRLLGRQSDREAPVNSPKRPGLPLPSVTRQAGRQPQTRRELIVEIQAALERANCLYGNASGSWDTKTRRAALKFLQAVNARLPTDRPDSILLQLLRSYHTATCTEGADQLTKWAVMPHVNDSRTRPSNSDALPALNSFARMPMSDGRGRISSRPVGSLLPHPPSARADNGIE
jgi:hypothetical protein